MTTMRMAQGNSGRVALWGAIALLLLAPLVAMQFTAEVRWTGFDFLAAGVMLVGGGLAYELVARRTADRGRRMLVGAAILGLVMLVWAEGAVGIF